MPVRLGCIACALAEPLRQLMQVWLIAYSSVMVGGGQSQLKMAMSMTQVMLVCPFPRALNCDCMVHAYVLPVLCSLLCCN